MTLPPRPAVVKGMLDLYRACAGTQSSLLQAAARVPGLAPWLQEAPIEAQMLARHRAALTRQISLVSGEIDFRVEHEVPALLAGRRARIQRLEKAVHAADAAGDAGRSLLFSDHLAAASAQLHDDQAVLAGISAQQHIDARAAAALDATDDESVASAGSEQHWDDSDDPMMRAAMELMAEQEADARAAVPHEPLQEDEGGLIADDSGSTGDAHDRPAHARDPCGDDMDLFPIAGAHRTLCLVDSLDAACALEHRSTVLLAVSERGIMEQLCGEDFQSLRPEQLITSAVLNAQTVLVQVRALPMPTHACHVLALS